ncbi:unnamed protein product [Effrenium voratum]|uniref:JmjC domain-containing protein n=1 Tax=Effrenium voratum TaxID=2562239 RepID=A0AA36HSX6_9DINO|nr:unnamed protein product [Effrenium voratum]CAJ1424759.1 unnamed protein product [Effrenium voratum]
MTRCMASFARLILVTAAAASRCDFQRVSADSLTKGFAKIHNEPLLITDTAWSRANASQKAFRQIFGRLPVQLTRNLEFQSRVGSKPEAINSTFGAWVDSLAQGDVPYLFEFCHHALCEEMESAYGVPELLQESSMRMYLSAGKVAKGVAFHQHRQTWGLLLAGRKVWYVAPPLQLSVPPFRHKEEAELEGISSLQRCEQEEGEVVYLPRDWWHATFNKADWNLAIGGQGQIAGSAFQANRGELDAKAVKKMSKMERDSLRRSAVENGHVDALELLIAAKALVFPSLKGWTALHDASKADAAVLDLLLDQRLDLNAAETGGKTVAHNNPSKEALELLLLNRADLSVVDQGAVTVAHEAAFRGHVGSLQLLAKAGISRSEPCSNGATPAHFAAAEGHAAVLRELLSSRVDLTKPDFAGGSLAHHAASQGHLPALRLLLDEGLPSGADQFGRTLMHEAAASGVGQVLTELRARGFGADARGAQMAAEGGHVAVLKQLASWGVDVKSVDRGSVHSSEVLEFLHGSEL